MIISANTSVKAIFTGIILLVIACIDPIEFEQPDTLQNTLSIQGKLAIGESNYISVSIRKVFDFSSTPQLVRAQSVMLFDESDNEMEIPSSAAGIHFLDFDKDNVDFNIDYNKCYRVSILLFDGRKYESGIECLLPVPTPESLTVSKVEEEVVNGIGELERANLLEFSISTPLQVDSNSDNTRLLWELETTYKFSDSPDFYRGPCGRLRIQVDEEKKTCFFTESTFFNYVPFDGTKVNQTTLTNNLVWKILPSFIFAEGLYLTLFQQSLTPTAHTYWRQVNQLTSRKGDVFEATDAKVITNFINVDNPKEEVYGYFYATEEKLVRAYVSPEYAGNIRPFCPEPFPFGTPPADCCNCLSNRNSTLEKPSWWQE